MYFINLFVIISLLYLMCKLYLLCKVYITEAHFINTFYVNNNSFAKNVFPHLLEAFALSEESLLIFYNNVYIEQPNETLFQISRRQIDLGYLFEILRHVIFPILGQNLWHYFKILLI